MTDSEPSPPLGPPPVASGPSESGTTQTQLDLSAAEIFAHLCDSGSSKAATAQSLWTFLGYRVLFDESVQVIVSGFWKLDSAMLLSAASFSNSIAYIPIPPIDASRPAANRVVVTSPIGRTEPEPIPYNTLQSMLPDAPDTWRKFLAIPMTNSEYSSFPVVKLASKRVYQYRKLKLSRLHRQLLPVGKMEITFDEMAEFQPISVSPPTSATLDWIVIRGRLELSDYARQIEDSIRLIEESPNSGKLVRMLQTNLELVLAQVAGDLGLLATEIDRAVRDAKAKHGLTNLEELQWSKQIRSVLAEISKWRQEHTEPSKLQLAEVVLSSRLLADNTLVPEISFAYPTCVTQSGTDVGRASLDGLRSALGKLRPRASLKAVVLPFTFENMPGNHSRGAAGTLIILSVMMLIVSTIDLSWLIIHPAIAAPMSGIPRPPLAGSDISSLREALVALLLIFPAALYAQFFENRPRSPLGASVQFSTFAAVSLIFFLPIVPAALLAIGWGSKVLSASCTIIAFLSLVDAMIVTRLYSQGSLRRMRVKELELTVKDWLG